MTTFELITAITFMGGKLEIEQDFSDEKHTLTVTVTYHKPAFSYYEQDEKGKLVEHPCMVTHFHSGYPDCNAEHGERSLRKNLESILEALEKCK